MADNGTSKSTDGDRRAALARLEAAAEAAYGRMRESKGRAALHGNFSDMKSAFHAAIDFARQAGLETDAARLDRRLHDIRAEADRHA